MNFLKRIVCIVLSLSLIACIYPIISASAYESENIFKDVFVQTRLKGYYSIIDEYEELYYHRNNNDEMDWALIYATTYSGTDEMIRVELDDIVIEQTEGYVPFLIGYAVYDIIENKFYDIIDVWKSDKFKNLHEIFEFSYYKKHPDEKKKNNYENNFIEWSLLNKEVDCLKDGYSYNELFTHNNANEIDWVLVSANYLCSEPDDLSCIRLGGIGGRTIISDSLQSPFLVGYGIYDVKENKFYGLEQVAANNINSFSGKEQTYNFDKYEGLIDALSAANVGMLTGDTNSDGYVNILDATAIQKSTVDKTELGKIERLSSDLNNDGIVDVFDATMIQKYSVDKSF